MSISVGGWVVQKIKMAPNRKKYGTAQSLEPTEVQKGLFLSLIEEAPDKEARLHPFILAWLINLTAIPLRSITNEQISCLTS